MRSSAIDLRRQLSERNASLAEGRPHESTNGAIPSLLYQELDGTHGNFLTPSYRRICTSPEWSRRLKKTYSASRRLARSDRVRRELDCPNSSDALLMNIFCYPGVTHRKLLCVLLGIEAGLRPQFGVKPGTPLANGRADRTEIDMVLGDILVEAKLTEASFQRARPDLVLRYRDVHSVFDLERLTDGQGRFEGYQLLRGVLAAHHCATRFALFCDGRRGDLVEA